MTEYRNGTSDAPTEQAPARPSVDMHISGVYQGYPITIDLHASIDKLPDVVARMKAAGIDPAHPARPASRPASAPSRPTEPPGRETGAGMTPHFDSNGHPCCPYDNTPMMISRYDDQTYFCPNKHPKAHAPRNNRGYCGYLWTDTSLNT